MRATTWKWFFAEFSNSPIRWPRKRRADLAQRLDALIGEQRNLVASARQVVEASRVPGRPDVRPISSAAISCQLAVEQRKLLSDSQALSQTAREELDVLNGKGDEEKTPQDKVREAQLNNVLHYTNRAEQRMGQARSQMRQRQAERAFRRASMSLDELKRARDQLRGPVEVLDVVLADATSLAQLTAAQAAATGVTIDAASPGPEIPSWLTGEYLEESQQSATERTAELVARLQAGLEQQPPKTAGPPTPQQQQQNAEADRFLAMVREAMPFLNSGQTAFEAAGQAMTSEDFSGASRKQLDAINSLRSARERFLELRGLVELAHSREAQIKGLLPAPSVADKLPPKNAQDEQPDKPEEQLSPQQRIAATEIAQALQGENLERAGRIGQLIEAGLAELPQLVGEDAASAGNNQPDPEKEQAAAERQQLEMATQFLDLARKEMQAAAESMGKSIDAASSESPTSENTVSENTKPEDAKPEGTRQEGNKPERDETKPVLNEQAIVSANEHVSQAIEHLQALRRLFFSVVEHLRETAQRQAHLNDETERAAALDEEAEATKAVGPLATRQQELQRITAEIAKALAEQAQQQPPGAGPQQNLDPKQLEQMQQIQERFGEAAKLVEQGGTEMESSHKHLAFKDPLIDKAREHQDQALQKLAEALALLQPPPPPEQQNQQNQQQQDQQQQQQGQDQKEKEQPETGTDPARLLQAIRDREAERRREKDRRQRLEREPVEKDW